jgi:hypothetical protein
MIHRPYTLALGDADVLRREAGALDKMEQSIARAYLRTGQSEAQILRWMHAETWFSAAEALDAGLVDEVMPAAGLAAAAAFRPRGAGALHPVMAKQSRCAIQQFETLRDELTAKHGGDQLAAMRAMHLQHADIVRGAITATNRLAQRRVLC